MKKTIKNTSLAIVVISNPIFAAEVETLHSLDFCSKSTVIHSFSDGAEVSIIKSLDGIDDVLDGTIRNQSTPT